MHSSTYSNFDATISPSDHHVGEGYANHDDESPCVPFSGPGSNCIDTSAKPNSCDTRKGNHYVVYSPVNCKRETQSWFLPSQRSRRSSSIKNCLLCLLITAVLLFAGIIAIFIGHATSNDYVSRVFRNLTLAEVTVAFNDIFLSKVNNSDTLQKLTSTSGSTRFELTTPYVKTVTSSVIYTQPDLNLTVSDVYPPSYMEDYGPAIHRASGYRSQEEAIVLLPYTTLPLHYDLRLDLSEYETNSHIYGNVSVLFESFGNSTDDEVVFHAASNIFIHRLRVRHDGQSEAIRAVQRQFKNDIVRVQLKNRLKATWYTLEMEFRTKICQSPFEGAQCVFKNSSNMESRIVSFTTKFEPTFARTFLPCWDEPKARTTFNISIRHPKNVTVLTNVAPNISKRHRGRHDSLITTNYSIIQKMPVYLLAFAIGDFVSVETRTKRNVRFTLWATKESAPFTHYATIFSPTMFDKVENSFGIVYPLSKMDFVAVNGFSVGGMENWGLVIFDEKSILLSASMSNSKNATVDEVFEQYKVEKIVTHEIIHQWFGNLVTMSDWSELWLNEGFASYFVYDFLNDKHPYLTDNEYFVRLIELLDRQTSTSRTPLVRSLQTAGEINDMFDSVQLYAKGAVIVKMIKDLLGAAEFKMGITKFLKDNAWKSVSNVSLWGSLPSYANHGADNEKLNEVMQPWLTNEGMPEVIISRNYDDRTIRITQRVSDQNRYIVYLNDVTYHTRPPSVTKTRTRRRQLAPDDDSSSHQSSRVYDRRVITADLTDTELATRKHDGRYRRTTKSNTTEGNVFDNALFDLHIENTTVTPKNSGRRGHKKGHKHVINNLAATQKQTSLGIFSNHVKNQKPKIMDIEKGITMLPSIRTQSSEDASSEQDTQRKQQRRRVTSTAHTWSIPFSYFFGSTQSRSGRTLRQFWIHNETIRFVDSELASDQYILANPDWIYPYKINYDLDNWKMVIDQLRKNPSEIPTMSRAQLIIDGETYLKQSGVPHLYIKLLAYLRNETNLGVLLIGLDAVYSVIHYFSATPVNAPLLLYMSPVIEQFDQMLYKTTDDPELAALWLLSPQRLAKLYQLRCLANFASCQQKEQVDQWAAHPTALSPEQHKQITAICQYLFTQGGLPEVKLLQGLLKQRQIPSTVTLQLATCIRDESIIEEAVSRIVRLRNAGVYASVLQGTYSIQYNRMFREIFWRGITQLSLHERQLLFAVNTGKSDHIAQLLLHSVRTSEELEAVVQLLPHWPANLLVHIDYIRRKFRWLETNAVKEIQRFILKSQSM